MSRRLYFADMLVKATVFTLLVTITLPVYSWVAGGTRLYLVYLLAVPFFSMILLSRLFDSLLSFVVIHAAALASVYFWPFDFKIKIVFAAFMAVSAVYSFTERVSAESGGVSFAFLTLISAANAGCVMIVSSLGLYAPAVFFMSNVFAAAACYFLYRHVTDVARSLEAISLTTSQPVRTIIKFNNVAIAIFIALAAAAAVFSGYIPIAAALRGAGSLLFAALKFLLGRMSGPDSSSDIQTEFMYEQSAQSYDYLPPPGEPFILWVILEKIIMFLTTAAVIAGVIAGVAYLCYRLYKIFYANVADQYDVKEFISPGADSERASARRPGTPRLFAAPPSQRIRRLFYKKVRKHMKSGLKVERHQTAREIAALIKKTEDIDELAALYERARYYDA